MNRSKVAIIVAVSSILSACGMVDEESTIISQQNMEQLETENQTKHIPEYDLAVTKEDSQAMQFWCAKIQWEVCNVIGRLVQEGVIDNKKAKWLCKEDQDFVCYGE